MKILVVDDDPAIRDFCRQALKSEGHEVSTAETGEEAVQRLDEGRDI